MDSASRSSLYVFASDSTSSGRKALPHAEHTSLCFAGSKTSAKPQFLQSVAMIYPFREKPDNSDIYIRFFSFQNQLLSVTLAAPDASNKKSAPAEALLLRKRRNNVIY
jgi:hypothetical protein